MKSKTRIVFKVKFETSFRYSRIIFSKIFELSECSKIKLTFIYKKLFEI